MAGKPLTEQQKAERAVKAAVRKQVKELGPLYAEQVVVPDVQETLLQRRMGWSSMQEHLVQLMSDNYIGDAITEQLLRRIARQHLAQWFDELDKYRKETYPKSPSYGVSFWVQRLTTTSRVVYGYKRVAANNSIGFIAAESSWFPPENWTPPLTRADLPIPPPRCTKCRYYHDPAYSCMEWAEEIKEIQDGMSEL